MAAYILNQPALAALISSPEGPVAADLTRRAIRVVSKAKQLCPVDRGRLRSSISFQITTTGGDLVARVGTNVDYARYVHDGTGLYGPHRTRIVPKNSSVLVWTPRGQTAQVFARSTKGMKGRPFLRMALPAAA